MEDTATIVEPREEKMNGDVSPVPAEPPSADGASAAVPTSSTPVKAPPAVDASQPSSDTHTAAESIEDAPPPPPPPAESSPGAKASEPVDKDAPPEAAVDEAPPEEKPPQADEPAREKSEEKDGADQDEPEPAPETSTAMNDTEMDQKTEEKPEEAASDDKLPSDEVAAEDKEEKEAAGDDAAADDKTDAPDDKPTESVEPAAEKTGDAPKRGRPGKKDKSEATPKANKPTPKPRVKAAHEPPPADSPAATAGRRERRTVERLQIADKTATKSKSVEETAEAGCGTKFSDIEFIDHQITKVKADNLKVLHRACFGRPGTAHEIRKNLRKFNGYPFDSDSDECTRKVAGISKWNKSDVGSLLKLLGLERGGSKDDQARRVVDFLLKPTDQGKKKAKAVSTGTKRGRPSSGKKSSAADSSASEHQEESSEDDTAREPPAKKARAAPKASPKKMPTDAELKTTIKKMLANVNLENTTMKEMFKMVAAKFPKVDLTPRKDFIKSAVKAIIEARA